MGNFSKFVFSFLFLLVFSDCFGQLSVAEKKELRLYPWKKERFLKSLVKGQLKVYESPAACAGLGLSITQGFINGVYQGWTYDGYTSFTRKYGSSKYGFFGELSWTKRYYNRDPKYGVKPFYKYLPVFDFKHFAEVNANYGGISVGIFLGIETVQQPLKQSIPYLITCLAANLLSRQIGLAAIRA